MAVNLQSLLRPSKDRITDRAAFVQAVSRLLNAKARNTRQEARCAARDGQKAA